MILFVTALIDCHTFCNHISNLFSCHMPRESYCVENSKLLCLQKTPFNTFLQIMDSECSSIVPLNITPAAWTASASNECAAIHTYVLFAWKYSLTGAVGLNVLVSGSTSADVCVSALQFCVLQCCQRYCELCGAQSPGLVRCLFNNAGELDDVTKSGEADATIQSSGCACQRSGFLYRI